MQNRETTADPRPGDHPVTDPDPWSGFAHDPRDAANADLRASDQERDVVRQILATGFADGRLDREEFDERSDAVSAVRTLGQIPALVADLVPLRPAVRGPASSLVAAGPDELRRRAELAWATERRSAVLGFLGPTLICWAIWVAIGFGDGRFQASFPWPLIVMAATLVNLVRVLATREDSIRDEVQRLQRKQVKELERRDRKGRRGRRDWWEDRP